MGCSTFPVSRQLFCIQLEQPIKIDRIQVTKKLIIWDISFSFSNMQHAYLKFFYLYKTFYTSYPSAFSDKKILSDRFCDFFLSGCFHDSPLFIPAKTIKHPRKKLSKSDPSKIQVLKGENPPIKHNIFQYVWDTFRKKYIEQTIIKK